MDFRPPEPAVTRLVVATRSYLDTAKVYLSEPVEEHLAQLKRLAGSAVPQPGLPRRTKRWPSAVEIHQATEAIFDYIASTFTSHLVARFDVALDLETRNIRDARRVQDYLEKHLVQARQGSQCWNVKGGTLYSALAGARNVVVVYSDRVSKVSGRPCCHVEWRISSVPAVRAAEVWAITHLSVIDPQYFFARRLILREVPTTEEELVRFGNALLGQPKRKSPWFKEHRDGTRTNVPMLAAMKALRESVTARGGPNAADVLSRIGRRYARHFSRISVDWMLPHGGLEHVPTSKGQTLYEERVIPPDILR